MRKAFPVPALALLLIALSACGSSGSAASPAGSATKAPESASKPAEGSGNPSWKIAVEGLGKEAAITNADLEKIGIVTVKAAMKEKETMAPTEEWTGVPLSKALTYLGVTQYTTVKVESADGASSREYTPDLVDSEGTILGTGLNGKLLDAERGPVQLVVNGKGSNWWIKQVANITIVK